MPPHARYYLVVYGVMLLGTVTLTALSSCVWCHIGFSGTTALSGCVCCHVGYNAANCMHQYAQYYLVVYGLMWGTIALTALSGCVSCHV